MERNKRKNLLEKTAKAFDLPGDVLAGMTCVKLVGREELYPVSYTHLTLPTN